MSIRSVDRTGEILRYSNVQRAARFIYLNKAGYNGLWRVNSKGQNNVPYGSHKKINVPEKVIIQDSKYLKENNVKILNQNYTEAITSAKEGDFVYFDPPYIPVNQTANFTNYTPNGFGLVQQKILRDTALQLASKGVNVMLSNADLPLTAKLYSNPEFKIHHVQAKRSINSNGTKKGKVGEVIITTY